MSNQNEKNQENKAMDELMNNDQALIMPKVGDLVKGKIISLSKTEIYVDIEGVTGGLVRGKEMVDNSGEFSNLKVGDEITATVIDQENEKGLLELSLRSAGQQKIWQELQDLRDKGEVVEIKIDDANKGGLMASYKQYEGFLPVSQLSKENYPRVEGGNKSRIFEKLRALVGQKLNVKIIDANESENKIIFSEKEVYAAEKKESLAVYKIGDVIECTVSGLVDFGVFVEFGDGLEGLIHISELAWQRIDHPKNLYKLGDKIQAQIISIEGDRVTLSAKKLVDDPWKKAAEKYQIGQIVKGKVLKIDKFGVFVELDTDIHGLAHISELSDEKIENAEEVVKVDDSYDFRILSIEPENHRLGLSMRTEEAVKH